MVFKIFKQPSNVFEFGVSVFNQPNHVGIYFDFIFFAIMFEFKKKS